MCIRDSMNSKIDLFRMNSLRVISFILEPQYISQFERYIKNAINEKVNAIASAAIICGFHLYPKNVELVKKWSNEITEKLNSKNTQTHYHALVLLHEIKKQDLVSFIKVLVNITRDSGFTNPLAIIQVVRFIKEVIQGGELDSSTEGDFVEYLTKLVHKNNDMIVLEAAKTLCDMKNLTNKELTQTVSVLSIYLLSSSSVSKFAALKILNKLISNPIRVNLLGNTQDIENLLNDNNKSLSSLAISILLKVCKEDNIEKLLAQIFDYMSEISDEFKIDIIKSVQNFVRKLPKKFRVLLNFLSNCLKGEGSYEVKRSCVDAVDFMINEIPESKEAALLQLAEYIEDCSHAALHIKILNMIRKVANQLNNPSKFIRFINNRILLEDSEIRAAALGALGGLSLENRDLAKDIVPILQSHVDDPEDEVRQRSVYYLNELQSTPAVTSAKPVHLGFKDIDRIERFLINNLAQIKKSADPTSIGLEKIEEFYKSNPQARGAADKKEEVQAQEAAEEVHLDQDAKDYIELNQMKKLIKENEYLSSLGELRLMTSPKDLTDTKSDFYVTCTKYMFDSFILLELKVRNKLVNQILKDVCAEIVLSTNDLKIAHIFKAELIRPDQTGSIFISIAKNPELRIILTKANCYLKYVVCETNSRGEITNSYDDEYMIDDIEINAADYLRPLVLPNKTFKREYEKYVSAVELSQSFMLGFKTLESAIKALIQHFGMYVCDESEVIDTKNKFHTLLLAGKYLGVQPVFAMLMMGIDANRGCLCKLQVKSEDETVASDIIGSFSIL
eukprot:TRINITY_DN3444_c0_g1_i1.p1 TRINITY_DN3444_c0_g1~~TRINITY_DN3444_c0_g1_i1.p1  ORF type:complete len:808 (-),score=249.76 TRINITY_DN3444_c0_g1_i1:153-2516(-)